jgi:hypothetical protein
METKVLKEQVALGLDEVLVSRLRTEAERANRSLSDYVECILMNSVYREPNEITLEAVKEARSGKFAGTIDMSNFDAFMKSVNYIE